MSKPNSNYKKSKKRGHKNKPKRRRDKYFAGMDIIKINDKEYKLPDFTTMNHAISVIKEMSPRILTTCRSPLDMAMETISNNPHLTEDAQKVLIDAAMEKEEDKNRVCTSIQFDRYIGTPDGLAHLLHTMLKDRYPDITEQEIKAWALSLTDDMFEETLESVVSLDNLPEPTAPDVIAVD